MRYRAPRTALAPAIAALGLGCAPGDEGAGPIALSDVTEEVGVSHVYDSDSSPSRRIIEILGGGIGVIDFDRDGDFDLVFTQAGDLTQAGGFQPRLLENRLVPDGVLTFVDRSSLLPMTGYGLGIATGDFDGDGWTDLFFSNFGADQLFRNEAGHRFVDVSSEAGVADPRLGTSAAFFDYDRDGHVDLAVARYLEYSTREDKACYGRLGHRDYCGPMSYPPVPDVLYRNRGDGSFEDVSHAMGFVKAGTSLGVVATDLDGDGWPDLYVANDGLANHLWFNEQGVAFTEDALMAGAAVNAAGAMEASMGVAVADIDRDGDFDLFMTHLLNETNTLYLNDGGGRFVDAGGRLGLDPGSIGFTGFGTVFADLDHDGWDDLFIANGGVRVIEAQIAEGIDFPVEQTNQLFRGSADGFTEVSETIPALAQRRGSRGVAAVDLDNDGDRDLVVGNANAPAQVLRNESASSNHWVGIEIVDAVGAPALGARVTVQSGEHRRVYEVRTAGSYLSASDPRIVVGLGSSDASSDVTVRWPTGEEKSVGGLSVGRYHRIALD